jgi:hypothetical protein
MLSITRHMLGALLLMNPATGATFYRAKVRTLGGEVDVVRDAGTGMLHSVARVGQEAS